MFLDKSLTLCENESIGTSDQYIGDVLDFGKDLPAAFAYGKPMALFIQVQTALAGSSTPTADFQLRMGSGISSDNINAGATTIVSTGSIAATSWSAGAWWGVYLPVGSFIDYTLRYMQMYFQRRRDRHGGRDRRPLDAGNPGLGSAEIYVGCRLT